MTNKISPASWALNEIDEQLIDLAFREDLGWPYLDLTTSLMFPESNDFSHAKVISKEKRAIILCGLPLVEAIVKKLTLNVELHSDYKEGDEIPPSATLFTLRGAAKTLLMSERIILNFLQRLCAIATYTHTFAQAIQHTSTKILDTRKTSPGFRHLEKYAVHCGGGVNHRMGLYDAIMIKDTHIDFLGGITQALTKLPHDILKNYPVIVEVRTIDELKIVLQIGIGKVSRVLLDNMSTDLMTACVQACQGKMITEASGNINLENVKKVAECGVDFISVGKITHSAGSVDLSMKCDI